MTGYHAKGFGLKAEVAATLAASYHSPVVDRLRDLGHAARAGDVVFRLAADFGFCYGVDRAVDYAYQTRARFPDRQLYLSGEIIHNPEVNRRLGDLGIRVLPDDSDPARRYAVVQPGDVVLLPAFGVTRAELEHLRGRGCVLVDTTCGSVLNVWKNVQRYARDGFTAVIHGKHGHEETRATASQTLASPGGQYLCLRDRAEAEDVAAFIRGRVTAEDLRARFAHAASPGFEPGRDLQRIGLANQTTMLKSESLEVQEVLRQAMVARWGEAELPRHFRAFDTICSATQDRQDAVARLLAEGPDLVLVVGGYNSSNTQALARICAAAVPTFHIEGAPAVAPGLRHRPVGTREESTASGWLPHGPLTIGLTAGASTPDSALGQVIERVLALRGLETGQLGPV